MYNINMLPCRQLLLCSLILIIRFSFIISTTPSTKFNITLQTPGKTAFSTITPHKSVHVKYSLSSDEEQWTIVGFEPELQSHRKAVEQLTVHLCDSSIAGTVWYDDKTICNNGQSMLIYEWTSYSSRAPFRLPEDRGFPLDKSKTIILTVIYKKEKLLHKEQTGILLYISTEPLKYRMGSMIVGSTQSGTSFSCRSSTSPRLLYGIKKLSPPMTSTWWRIYIIRVRQFGRKFVESVFTSESLLNTNRSNTNILSSDYFLMDGDYLFIECDDNSQTNCYFLIYYTYKSKIDQKNICQHNDFPNLFKLIPSRESLNNNQTMTETSGINGSTIFLIICIILFVIWISIIIGCIIMRRIRGLVNYRTEPSSPIDLEKNKFLGRRLRNPNDQFNQRTGDADHIMQHDGEHAGH